MSQKLHPQPLSLNNIPPQEREAKERNDSIISLYKKGNYSCNSLARMYKISPQRIHQIIKRNREKHNFIVKELGNAK